MKTFKLWTALAGLALAPLLHAQEVREDAPIVSQEVASQVALYSYAEGPESHLDLRGTPLAPRANGDVDVEYQSGRAAIDAKVDEMPLPWSLGAYTTYVLWAVTGEGRATNLGEFVLKGDRASLDTAASLSEFALIVTAEPHFAVSVPSQAVVLQNVGQDVKGKEGVVRELAERADYSRLPPQSPDARGKTPIDLYGARYAVAIAEAAGAQEFAPEAYTRAQAALQSSEAAQASRKSSDRKRAPQLAREAIQSGEDARREAMRGQAAAAVAATAATAARAQAEAQTQEARAEAAEADALRARRDLQSRLNALLPTQETDRGLVAVLAGVQFATGKSSLNPSARETLSHFAGVLGAFPGLRLDIEGHTDSTGLPATNEKLSLERAMAVRDYLSTQGVAAGAIEVQGFGSSRPVALNETVSGREQNRRVEIIVSGGPLAAKTRS